MSYERRLDCIVVTSDRDALQQSRKPVGPRYTRDGLKSLLLLLGCKPRHAHKLMTTVFETLQLQIGLCRSPRGAWTSHPHEENSGTYGMPRQQFKEMVAKVLTDSGFKLSPASDDLKVASSLQERRRCVIILLSGTSGTGKSTVASLLASRLGITTAISTDSIRHMLRGFTCREENPLLYASTYQAGDVVTPATTIGLDQMSAHERTVKGYKAQCELVMEHLERLVASCEQRCESMICEGVHLCTPFVVRLMQRHPSVVPFLVYIHKEELHMERMAVRARDMTLDPNKNRYIKYMKNIRCIQDYLVRKSEKHLIPRVENSNIDRSLAVIHTTVLGTLKRVMRGEPALDAHNTARTVHGEYVTACETVQSRESFDMPRGRGSPSTSGGAGPSNAAGPSSAAGPSNGTAGASCSNGLHPIPASPCAFSPPGASLPLGFQPHTPADITPGTTPTPNSLLAFSMPCSSSVGSSNSPSGSFLAAAVAGRTGSGGPSEGKQKTVVEVDDDGLLVGDLVPTDDEEDDHILAGGASTGGDSDGETIVRDPSHMQEMGSMYETTDLDDHEEDEWGPGADRYTAARRGPRTPLAGRIVRMVGRTSGVFADKGFVAVGAGKG